MMVLAVYERFRFDHLLMDVVLGRWSKNDLDDPRVWAIVHYMESTGVEGESYVAMCRRLVDDPTKRNGIHTKADPVLSHMLHLQADRNNHNSIYQTALPFFMTESDIATAGEQYEVGALLAD